MKAQYRLYGGTLVALLGVFAVGTLFTAVPYVQRHLFTRTYKVVNTKPVSMNLNGFPMEGYTSAPVTIVEYGDFKCSTCQQWDEQVYPKLQQQFIKTGEAKFYFKPYLVIYGSTDAALAGLSIYQQSPSAFWKYYKAIYAHQQKENVDWATPTFLNQFITQYVPGVAASKVMADISDKKELPEINATHAEGKQIGVGGTPTIYINGYKLQNPFDYAAITKLILHDEQKAGS